MSTFEFTARYSEQQVRDAVRTYHRYMIRRHLNWKFLLGESAFIAVMLWCYALGVPWAVWVLVATIILELFYAIALHRALLSQALEKYHDMGAHEAQIIANDEFLSVRSALGMSEVPWRTLRSYIDNGDTLIVIMRNRSMFGIPKSGVASEAMSFIRHRIEVAGGAA